jgi:hypothetical protein
MKTHNVLHRVLEPQLLQGDRLVGGPRGLPVLAIFQHFREGVQEALAEAPSQL